jgi:coenzyme F420-reducing hydrogenase beta subunit
MERIPRSKQSVRYLLGLACGMYQNRFYTELLLAESGVDRKGVKKIEYRRKSDGAAPSDFRFRGTDNRGPGRDIAYHGLPFYLGKNAFFRVNACNFCMDVFAEGADACYMDAWLPEYMNEPRGTSLVLVRNPQIRQLFDRGRTGKSLNLEEIGIEKMIASQAGHVRRKRYLIDMRRGSKMDRSTGRPFALSDRLSWALQRYAQRRSKEAWAAAGRSRGVRAFWSAAWDITLPIRIQEAYDRTVGRVLRLMARIRR